MQWFTSIGYFTIIPYFAYFLTEHLHFSVAFVGVQMTLLLAGQYSTTLLGGTLSDRRSPASIMLAGLLIQIVCYFLLACGPDQKWQISGIALAIGIGKSLYTPAAKKLALAHAAGVDSVLLFSLRSTINNVGVALGSLIGALSINAIPWLFFASAGLIQCLALLCLLSFVRHPSAATAQRRATAPGIVDSFRTLLRFKGFMVLAFLYCGFHMLYIQLEFTFPLEAAQRFSAAGISSIFLTNSLVVIFLQIPVNVIFARHFASNTLLLIGYALMSVGFLILLPHAGMPVFALAVGLFTIGEIVVDPNIDAMTGNLVPEALHGSAFGVLGMFALFGGTLGNSFGALLFDKNGSATLWLLAGVFGMLLACIALLLGRRATATAMAATEN